MNEVLRASEEGVRISVCALLLLETSWHDGQTDHRIVRSSSDDLRMFRNPIAFATMLDAQRGAVQQIRLTNFGVDYKLWADQ
jgi:hypothetical protein